MLAKSVERGGKDWDERLPFVLFAYRASQQQSTLESPFFLLYGRDPRLPTDPVMSPEKTRKLVDLKEYGVKLAGNMTEAWELARQCIRKAQKKQKDYYDQKGRPANFLVGERVFLFKPADKTGHARKFARPFHGPFRVVDLDSNTAKIQRIDRPEEETVLVALDRLRHSPSEVPELYWPPDRRKSRKGKSTTSKGVEEELVSEEQPIVSPRQSLTHHKEEQPTSSQGEELEMSQRPPPSESCEEPPMDTPTLPGRSDSTPDMGGNDSPEVEETTTTEPLIGDAPQLEDTTAGRRHDRSKWAGRLRKRRGKNQPRTSELRPGEM